MDVITRDNLNEMIAIAENNNWDIDTFISNLNDMESENALDVFIEEEVQYRLEEMNKGVIPLRIKDNIINEIKENTDVLIDTERFTNYLATTVENIEREDPYTYQDKIRMKIGEGIKNMDYEGLTKHNVDSVYHKFLEDEEITSVMDVKFQNLIKEADKELSNIFVLAELKGEYIVYAKSDYDNVIENNGFTTPRTIKEYKSLNDACDQLVILNNEKAEKEMQEEVNGEHYQAAIKYLIGEEIKSINENVYSTDLVDTVYQKFMDDDRIASVLDECFMEIIEEAVAEPQMDEEEGLER